MCSEPTCRWLLYDELIELIVFDDYCIILWSIQYIHIGGKFFFLAKSNYSIVEEQNLQYLFLYMFFALLGHF